MKPYSQLQCWESRLVKNEQEKLLLAGKIDVNRQQVCMCVCA